MWVAGSPSPPDGWAHHASGRYVAGPGPPRRCLPGPFAKTDWNVQEQVLANLCTHMKRLLRKYGCPREPDYYATATDLIPRQVEVLSQASRMDAGAARGSGRTPHAMGYRWKLNRAWIWSIVKLSLSTNSLMMSGIGSSAGSPSADSNQGILSAIAARSRSSPGGKAPEAMTTTSESVRNARVLSHLGTIVLGSNSSSISTSIQRPERSKP